MPFFEINKWKHIKYPFSTITERLLTIKAKTEIKEY